jgi:hypothetical protein
VHITLQLVPDQSASIILFDSQDGFEEGWVDLITIL